MTYLKDITEHIDKLEDVLTSLRGSKYITQDEESYRAQICILEAIMYLNMQKENLEVEVLETEL